MNRSTSFRLSRSNSKRLNKQNMSSYRSISCRSLFKGPKEKFLLLVKQGSFDQAESLLNNELKCSKLLMTPYNGKGSLLHAILKHQPPVSLVDTLIQKMTDHEPTVVPEDIRDADGRTPLHIAANRGCHASVIQRLVDGVAGPIPAVTRDCDQRLPLHWACANPQGLRSNNKRKASEPKKQDIENMNAVVFVLLMANPIGVVLRDAKGLTPLDMAKRYGASQKIIDYLTVSARKHARFATAPNKQQLFEEASATENTEGSDVPTLLIASSLELSVDQRDDLSSIGWGGASTFQPVQEHSPPDRIVVKQIDAASEPAKPKPSRQQSNNFLWFL